MFKLPRIFITLNPPQNRPFYTTGDTLSGYISTEIDSSQFSYKDIQLKLKCDEFFPNGKHKKRSKRKQEKWNRRIDVVGYLAGVDLGSAAMTAKVYMHHKKHFTLVANVASGSDKGRGDEEVALEQGRHQFPFEIIIPERANSCPPSAYMGQLKDGVVGVIWTLKVVLHRNSGFKADIRETKIITVFPKEKGTVKIPDFDRRNRLFGTHKLYSKRGFFKERQPNLYLSGEFTSPRDGIPQGPIPPHCSLLVTSDPAPINITGLKISLVRVFKGHTLLGDISFDRKFDWFTDEIVLSRCSLNRDISQTTDLTSLLQSSFKLNTVLPRAFSSEYMKVYYVLEVRVYCRHPIKPSENRKAKEPEHLLLRGPINVASPLACYMSEYNSNIFDDKPVSPDDIEKLNKAHEANMDQAEKQDSDYTDEKANMPDYPDLDTGEELPVYSVD